MKTQYGVQNYQTGLIEETFDKASEASKKCNELNGRYAGGPEEMKEFRVVEIVNGKIQD